MAASAGYLHRKDYNLAKIKRFTCQGDLQLRMRLYLGVGGGCGRQCGARFIPGGKKSHMFNVQYLAQFQYTQLSQQL
jgi:hypothetical protein